jgi:Papain-like cysteine protease AvrRpt2
MESFYKSLPRVVIQDNNKSCWAAVLESWLAILPNRTFRPSQQELLESYPDFTFPDGSIIPDEFADRLAPQVGMECEWISQSQFKPSYLAGKLASKGHLVIGYRDTSRAVQGGHVVVCYGVGRPKGTTQMVSVMDPSRGEGHCNRTFDYFNPMPSHNNQILIGSPKLNLPPGYF